MIYQWIISCLSGSKLLILQGLQQNQRVFWNKPLSFIQKYGLDIWWPHIVFRYNNIFAYQTYVLLSYRWNRWLRYMFMIITRFISLWICPLFTLEKVIHPYKVKFRLRVVAICIVFTTAMLIINIIVIFHSCSWSSSSGGSLIFIHIVYSSPFDHMNMKMIH